MNRCSILPFFLSLAACSESAAQSPSQPSSTIESVMTTTLLNPDDVALPRADVELPELPYDKEQLPKILELDDLIVLASELRAAAGEVDGRLQKLKLAASTSLNGTHADQIKGLMKIVDDLETFAQETLPMAAAARSRFTERFGSEGEFSSRYRETYAAAEESLDDIIADNAKRRAVSAAMGHSYRNAPTTNLSYLESMMEESQGLRDKAIEQVVRGAETDMMVADYKKGHALAELLQGTRNKLALARTLDPENESIARVLAQVDEKQKDRKAEVEAARAAERFPSRYGAANAPENVQTLEKSIRETLMKNGHEVKAVHVASEWIAVHSGLGIHLYNQVDFHVAVTSKIETEAEAGVLDVLYVTGKTGGTALDVPFARYSIGTVAQMLEENL